MGVWGLRLLWQDIFTEEIPFTPNGAAIWATLEETLRKSCLPDTQLDFRRLQRCAPYNWFPSVEMVNDLHLLDSVVGAAPQYDAAMVGCCCDPALTPLRGALDIPVVGLLETGMLLAQTLGARLAVVTVWDGYVPIMERLLRLYGWENRAIHRPVRHFPLDWENLVSACRGEPGPLIAAFESVAQGCVADGADVLVVGCAYVGPAFVANGYTRYARHVPVVDCATAAIKMAELQVQLARSAGLAKSQAPFSPFRSPGRRRLDEALAPFRSRNPAD